MAKTTGVLAAAALAVVLACAPAVVHAELKPPCTGEQLQAAQAAIDAKLIETSCPEIAYVNGNPDYKNTAFCANDACVKAIKKTKKALPKCSYDGVNVRKGPIKLLKACEKLNGSGDDDKDDDDDDKDASTSTSNDASATPASSKTPKPSKTPKVASTATPTPTTPQEIGKVIGATDGSADSEIGKPIGPAPAPTTVTPTPTPAPNNSSPSTLTSTSSASTTSYGTAIATTLVAVVSSAVWVALA